MKPKSFPLSVLTGLVAGALLVAAPALGQKPVAATISLKHADAADVIVLLKKNAAPGAQTDAWLPDGVTALNVTAKGRALSVKGTPDGVKLMQGLVSLLDVPARRVQVKLRVVQVAFAADGTKTESVLQQPVVTTTHNKPAEIRVVDRKNRGVVIRVTPRVPGDGQATLLTLLSVVWPNGSRDSLERPVRVPLGTTRRVVGVTNSSETPVIQAVGRGDVPGKWSAACLAVYVEATPTELKPSAGRTARRKP